MKNGNYLKTYYENTACRFWDASSGPVGRDLVVYPLLKKLQGSLLEYGCGAGSLLVHLAKEERFNKVYGVDISKEAMEAIQNSLESCPTTLKEKLVLCQPDDTDSLPQIPDGVIDVIVCVATIEHVLNPYAVLDELYRIARLGATLVCSVPNLGYIKHRIGLLAGRLPRTGTDEPIVNWRKAGWDGMHLHAFTKSAFHELLVDCGWEPVRWTGWGTRFSWINKLRSRYPGLFSGEIIATCRKTVTESNHYK